MLDGLADVPWADLEHAYGSAADVPDLLAALRDSDPEVRERVRFQLYGNIFHQGTRYEASAYAAPFLLELLADPATPDRADLLDLLSALAVGYDENWLPGGFPVAEYRERAVGGEALLRAAPAARDELDGDEEDGLGRYDYWQGLDEDQQARMFAYVELAVYDAVRAGVPLFRELLAEQDAALRVAAAYALGWFAENAAGSVAALTATADVPEPAVAATALVALGLLGVATSDALDDPRDLVRWAAAVAQARVHGPAADPRAATELLTWTGGTSKAQEGIPYYDGDLAGYAARALHQFGTAHQDATFDALLLRIPAVSGVEALPVAGEALRLAFPAGPAAPGTTFAALDDRQRRLVHALLADPATWRLGEHNFGNFRGLVGYYGLPATFDELWAYAATE